MSSSSSPLDPSRTFAALCAECALDARVRKALSRLGLVRPTLVQSRAIPLALTSGRDLLVRARTGSGKTLAYCVPVVQKVLTRKELAERGEAGDGDDDDDNRGARVSGVILVPTRELCDQVDRVLSDLTYYCSEHVKVAVLSSSSRGGKKRKGDAAALKQEALLRDGPDIVVATPAGLVSHVRGGRLDLRRGVETLVVDEADLILSFGYADDVTEIMKSLPKTCQGFLMSATLSPELQALKKVVLHSPAVLKLEEDKDDPALRKDGNLLQFYLDLPSKDKYLVLYVFLKLGLLRGKGLFFVNTVDAGYRLKLFLEQFHIRSAVLNAELPARSRLNVIEHFNVGNFDYLVATDESASRAGGRRGEGGESEKKKKKGGNKRRRDGEYGASRGIDFRGVSFVVNVDLPDGAESYVHRIGRTARGGANGVALTLVDCTKKEEREMLDAIRESQPVKGETRGDGGEGLKEATSSAQGDMGGAPYEDRRQPSPLDFDLKEIEGFRYRVEDVSRAVTRVAIREARAAEVKAEILNSERLQSHFEENPADLQLLQHDRRATHVSKVQDHLKHVPGYMLPRGMQVSEGVSRKRRKKKTRSQRVAAASGQARNKANDPLQNFDGEVNMDGLAGDDLDHQADGVAGEVVEEGKFFDEDGDDDGNDEEITKEEKNQSFLDMHDDGYGKSTAGRNAWKQKHNKGKFNRKFQQEKHEQLHKW